jgi:hypothetical protein
LRPFRLDTQLVQGSLNVLDFSSGFQISFQEMAFTLQSAGHVYAVSAVLEGSQQVENIHPAAARHLNDLDIAWIIQAHGSGQICSGVCTVLAAVSQDLRFKAFVHDRSPEFGVSWFRLKADEKDPDSAWCISLVFRPNRFSRSTFLWTPGDLRLPIILRPYSP